MTLDIQSLPTEIDEKAALEAAYNRDLYWVSKKLQSKASVLIECEKQLIPFVFIALRKQMRDLGIKLEYLDGREVPGSDESPSSVLRGMLAQITHWVRNASEERILVIPHLDLLVANSSQGEGLTTEARELIPLLYENPRVVFLAFQDPNFALSKVIQNLFPAKRKLLGIDRKCLSALITQREARKFPRDFNFNKLYQYVSGLNPVRIRQILTRLEGIDFPEDSENVFSQLREMTLDSEMEIPSVDLDNDVGGYASVKKKIHEEILGILNYRDQVQDESELSRIDSIIPKGIIFWGPPGTGKTYFAKAIANALNATILIVSGPELKSMWVGQSEENIRKIFFKARQSAPSIIVFDELDSFAGSRSKLSSTEVNHSMVNQLLTEMDGFRKEELVFVIGTTNFVSSLDAALLRPGRFEMKLEIPFPEEQDRLDVLKIYKEKMKLPLTEEQITYMAYQTGEMSDPMTGTAFTGDHLYSACRYLKRLQIRENRDSFDKADVHLALRGGELKRKLSEEERNVVAYHEAGHAVIALCLKDASPVERISVDSDYAEALGYIKQEERKNKFMVTKRQLLADLIVLMGGREAELLIFNDLSSGSENDIHRANYLVNEMVSRWGMSEAFGVQIIANGEMSAEALSKRDLAVADILEKARQKARQILEQRLDLVKALGETVLSEKVLERERIMEFLEKHAPGQTLNISKEISAWQS